MSLERHIPHDCDHAGSWPILNDTPDETIQLEVTPYTTETRRDLSYGDGYIVQYLDIKTGEKRLMLGIYEGPEFNFPAVRIRDKPMMPESLARLSSCNRVLGWCRVKDWRESNGRNV